MDITERLKDIILNETNIDVKEVSRNRNIIELRSLYYTLIKHFKPKLTLMDIAESVNKNHATVIHSLNNYKMYEMYNDELKQLRSLIIKQIELENILQTNDNDSLKLNIKQKNIKISELELEVELIKQKLTTFEKSEYDIINKLKELLNNTKETELHDLIKIRLKAMYDMNIKVMKQK
jgi:hypothetical protein